MMIACRLAERSQVCHIAQVFGTIHTIISLPVTVTMMSSQSMKSKSARILMVAACATLMFAGIYTWRSWDSEPSHAITSESNLADLIGCSVVMTGDVEIDKGGFVVCQGKRCVVLKDVELDDSRIVRDARVTVSGQLGRWVADPTVVRPSQGPASGEYFYLSNVKVIQSAVAGK